MHLKLLFLCVSLIPVISAVFTAAGIRALVDGHNAFRRKIAKGQYHQKYGKFPEASNMRKIHWDRNLAQGAQAFANRHPNGHDDNCKTGENMYWMYDMGPTSHDSHAPRAIKMWGDEFISLGMVGIKTGNGVGANGHATQMAWADTSKLGCGISNWKDGKYMKTVVVCRYMSPGNWPNALMYKPGAPASRCPAGTRPDNGLCA